MAEDSEEQDESGLEEELTSRQEDKLSFITGGTSIPKDVKDFYISKDRRFGIQFMLHKYGIDKIGDKDAQMIADAFDYEGRPYMN